MNTSKITRPSLAVAILLTLTIVPSAESQEAKVFVVGHRGLLQCAPENTLAGFRACLALRVCFEFDVRRTKDGMLVCLHDATVDRTTDGNGSLSDFTLAKLHQLDAGSRFDRDFRGERVPTIDAILRLLTEHRSDSALAAVDLKDSGAGLEEQIVRRAEELKVLDRLVFIGATIESPEIRRKLRAASAAAQAARLCKGGPEIDAAIEDVDTAWVYLRQLPSPDEVRRIHQSGKRIFVAGPLFAGEEAENWAAARKLGVDAVLTDHPLKLARTQRTSGN